MRNIALFFHFRTTDCLDIAEEASLSIVLSGACTDRGATGSVYESRVGA